MPVNYIAPNVSAPRISAPNRRLETLFGDQSAIKPSRADSHFREEIMPDQYLDTRMGTMGMRGRKMITRETRNGEFQDKIWDSVGTQGRNPRAYIPATPPKNGEVDTNGRASVSVSQGGTAGAVRFIDRVRAAANADQVYNGYDYSGVNFRGAVRSGHAGAYIDDAICVHKERPTTRFMSLDQGMMPSTQEEHFVATAPMTRMGVSNTGSFKTEGWAASRSEPSPSVKAFQSYQTYNHNSSGGAESLRMFQTDRTKPLSIA